MALPTAPVLDDPLERAYQDMGEFFGEPLTVEQRREFVADVTGFADLLAEWQRDDLRKPVEEAPTNGLQKEEAA